MTGRRARPRVLVVDDDEHTRELYAWCMRAAGWLVEAMTNGAEALVRAVTFGPDVILIDPHLPIIHGLEPVRRLKSHESTKDIPIVVCTAFAGNESEIEAWAAACDEFVVKPCAPEALRYLLEGLVAGRGRSSG